MKVFRVKLSLVFLLRFFFIAILMGKFSCLPLGKSKIKEVVNDLDNKGEVEQSPMKLLIEKYQFDKRIRAAKIRRDLYSDYNYRFCRILIANKIKCILKRKIRSFEEFGMDSCLDGLKGDIYKFSVKIKAKISSLSESNNKFFIIINEKFISTSGLELNNPNPKEIYFTEFEIVNQTDQKYKIKSVDKQVLIPPRFIDIYSILIVTEPYEKLPEKDLKLTLYANENLITTEKGELAEIMSNSVMMQLKNNNPNFVKMYGENLNQMRLVSIDFYKKYKEEKSCNISYDELQRTKEEIEKKFKLSNDYPEVEPPYIVDVDFTNKEKLEIIDQNNNKKSTLGDLLYQIDQLEEDHLDLSTELKSDENLGCILSEDIKEFQISLKGRVVNYDQVMIESTTKFPDRGRFGTGSDLFFDLGGVEFTIDKENVDMFNTTYTVPLPFSQKISTIDRFVIKKTKFLFRNDSKDCNATGLAKVKQFFFRETCYEVREKFVFEISGIDIIINGLPAYSKNFQDKKIILSHKNTFVDLDFKSNYSWINFVKNKCSED